MRSLYQENYENSLYFWFEEMRVYNGNDSVPAFMVNRYKEAQQAIGLDTSFFSYDNGRIVRDSNRSYDGNLLTGTIIFSYGDLGNGRYKTTETYRPVSDPDQYTDVYFSHHSFVNGNLTSAEDTAYFGWVGTTPHVFSFQYQFDGHINPCQSMGLPYLFPIPFYLVSGIDFSRQGTRRNNIISRQFRTDNPLGTTETGTGLTRYTYDADGLPLTAVYPGSGSAEKLVFVYQR